MNRYSSLFAAVALVSFALTVVCASEGTHAGDIVGLAVDWSTLDNTELVVADPTTGKFLATASFSPASFATESAFDSTTGTYYVGLSSVEYSLYAFNASSGELQGRISLSTDSLAGLSYDNVHRKMYAMVASANVMVMGIDLSGLVNHVATISAATGYIGDCTALDEAGQRYFAMVSDDHGNNMLATVDLAKGTVLHIANYSTSNDNPCPMVYDSQSQKLFTIPDGKLMTVDPQTGKMTAIAGADELGVLATRGYTIGGGKLFASNMGANILRTVDLTTGKVLQSATIEKFTLQMIHYIPK